MIVEPNELHCQDQRKLDDVELLATVTHAVAFRTSVRYNLRLQAILNALIQGGSARVAGGQVKGKLKEGFVLHRGPPARVACEGRLPLPVEEFTNERPVGLTFHFPGSFCRFDVRQSIVFLFRESYL